MADGSLLIPVVDNLTQMMLIHYQRVFRDCQFPNRDSGVEHGGVMLVELVARITS